MASLNQLYNDENLHTADYEQTMKSPSPHRLFSKVALQIIGPTVEQYGFVKHKKKAEKFFTEIIFRKNSQYIQISASTYPTDYPYFYNIILGDWQAIEEENPFL